MGQNSSLSLSSGTANPGGTVVLNLSLASSGSQPAGYQWTLAYSPALIVGITAVAGPSAEAASKTISCASIPGSFTCLLTGLNANAMPSGIVASIQLTLAANAVTTGVTINNSVAVDATGMAIPVSAGASATITVPSIASLTCPLSLSPGTIASCRVILDSHAPLIGSTVMLASSNVSLTVPALVTVPAGATTATFYAKAATTIANSQNAAVTATFGISSSTAAISLAAGSGGGATQTGSGLTAMPTSLTFSATPGTIPPAQQVSVASTVTGTTFAVGVPDVTGAWLRVTPATGNTDSEGTLTVTVDPTGLGNGMYSGSINIQSSDGGVASVPVTLTNEAAITVAPTSLNFSYEQGGAAPAAQGIAIFSNPAGVQVTAGSSGNWLTVSGGGATPSSVTVSVSQNLAPGTYAGTVKISSATAGAVNVPVTFTVGNLPPALAVSPPGQSLSLSVGTSAASGELTVTDTGGGTLRFTARATSDQGNWLKLADSGSGSAAPSTPSSLGFTADPTGLTPGLYTGQVTVTDASSGAQAAATVTLAVNQASQSLTLSQSALTFSALAGAQAPPSQFFTVTGQSSVNPDSSGWTATAQVVPNPAAPSANWLSVSPAGGSFAGMSRVQVSVDPVGLPAGQYYGSVDIAALNAVNSPQNVTVLLNVASATSSASVQFSTGGVTVFGPAGSATPQQQAVSLFNPFSRTVAYSSAVFTSDGSGWLSVSPANGDLSPGSSSIAVTANLAGLPAGLHTGTVNIHFDTGQVGVIGVTAIATGAAVASGACSAGKPSYLVPLFRQPLSLSALQVAVPQTVQLGIADDCGNPLTAANGGQAQVSFGNKDSPLSVHDVGGGIWEGTWTPVNPGGQVAVQAVGLEPVPTIGSIPAAIAVTVLPASANAPAQISGVMNAASGGQAVPGIVTPGSYVAIYGKSLTSGGVLPANTIPLPAAMSDTQVFVGNQTIPLIYVSPDQVNALIPRNLNPNTFCQLVVQRGSTRSAPAQLIVAGIQPGIYTQDLSGSGQGYVEIAGTALLAAPAANGSRPAQRGSDYLVAYGTGFGPVIGASGEAPPADGAGAPTGLIYKTADNVTATVGGVPAPVVFSGLTPTLVSLYQVNILVPAVAPIGSAVPLVLTVTDTATGKTTQSNTVTIAVQ